MAEFSPQEGSELARIFAIPDLEKRFQSMLPYYSQWAESERDTYQLPKEENLDLFKLTGTTFHIKVIGGQEVIVYETSDDELIVALSDIIRNLDAGTRKTHAVFFRKNYLVIGFDRLAYLFTKYVVVQKLPRTAAP